MAATELTRNDPTTNLPDEILGEIFAAGCPLMSTFSSPSWGRAADGGHPTTALVFDIVAVCRRWRLVAINTPSLWSNILLSFILVRYYLLSRSPSSNPSLVFESFVKTCLTRSASHPLDIDIRDAPAFDQFTYMMATSGRWRKLTVHDRELASMAECEAFKGLPRLRYLDIQSDGMCYNPVPHSPQKQVILDLPHLTTLHLSMPQVPVLGFKFVVPNVTHIDLSIWEGRLAEARDLLSNLPLLSHLSLGCMPNFEPPSPDSDPIDPEPFDLPSLQKLALKSQPQLVWRILSQCRVPSLKHLRIEVQSPRQSMDSAQELEITRQIDTFLSRCPQLESLTTQFVDFSHFKNILLRTQPRFVAFGRGNQVHTDLQVEWILQAIASGSDDTRKIAEFAIFGAGNYDPTKAADFVNGIVRCLKRMCSAGPLTLQPSSSCQRIDVHSPFPVEPEVEKELRDMHQRGLIPSTLHVQLHHHTQRDGYRCVVAENKWSTSTGVATADWNSTHYPYSP